MKITVVTTSALAIAALSLTGAPSASADPETTTLGSQAKLTDGAVVQGWTVTALEPSSDTIPYPVQGRLWEATATDQAIEGAATPIVSNFNARARSGETYRVLFGVATPQGVNPSTLAPGDKTTGKLYFDVTGDNPDSVVFNAGGQDLLLWVQPPPRPTSGSSSSYPSSATPSSAPDATDSTGTTGATPAAPAGMATPPAAGSSGTPISEGTPAAPAPAGETPATPAPASASAPATTPAPAGSSGTPVSEGTPAATAPAADQGPAPATPATPATTVTPPPAG